MSYTRVCVCVCVCVCSNYSRVRVGIIPPIVRVQLRATRLHIPYARAVSFNHDISHYQCCHRK